MATTSHLTERVSEIVESIGGVDAVSPVLAGMVARHARLEAVAEHLWHNLEDKGVSTGKGATRAAATLWLQVVDRLHKSSALLGLERKPRKVETVSDLMETER